MSYQRHDLQWPSRFDYDLAMGNLAANMKDPKLRHVHIETKSGIQNLGQPDSHACLYHIGDWMVRCFCRIEAMDNSEEDREPPEDILERYEKLDRFSQDNLTRVSALIPIFFVKEGIQVDCFRPTRKGDTLNYIKTVTRPLIRTLYMKEPALGTFIMIYHDNSHIMHQLSEAWLRMIREMEAVKMAHGDLDLTNILVQYEPSKQHLLLKLIDYDNTWIPDFDYMLPEHGHQAFQHPAFFGKSQAFNARIDRFSALVMYISLKALASHSKLYEQWGADETRLLFAAGDYEAEQHRFSSGRIAQLRNMRIPGLEPYIQELSKALQQNQMPSSLLEITQTTVGRSNRQSSSPEATSTPPQLETSYKEVIRVDWMSARYYDNEQRKPEHPPDSSRFNTSGISTSPSESTQEQQIQAAVAVPPTQQATDFDGNDESTEQQTYPGKNLAIQSPPLLGCIILVILAILVIVGLLFVLHLFHASTPGQSGHGLAITVTLWSYPSTQAAILFIANKNHFASLHER